MWDLKNIWEEPSHFLSWWGVTEAMISAEIISTNTYSGNVGQKGSANISFYNHFTVPLMSWTISMKLLGSVFESHACFFSPKSICWGECCINLCQQSIRKLMRALIYLFMYLPPFPELDSTLTLLFIFTANKRTNGTMNTWDHYSRICATKSIQGHSTRHWALVNSTHVERQQQKSFTLLWCDDRIPGKSLPHVI